MKTQTQKAIVWFVVGLLLGLVVAPMLYDRVGIYQSETKRVFAPPN